MTNLSQFPIAGWRRCAAVIGLSLAFLAAPVQAKTPPRHSSAPAQEQLLEHGSYTNSDGVEVHSPAHTRSGKAPAGASARCRDGSYSFSQHRRGTCSHHGGVAAWL
ncbi:DUF3761 domain-containing protein [Chromobacterium sp.]|uniref:DUF3761 domain-containing protein n=1 Tax=Chromobacterium sp. TaxID=306190 RepID=UPI0035B0E630